MNIDWFESIVIGIALGHRFQERRDLIAHRDLRRLHVALALFGALFSVGICKIS